MLDSFQIRVILPKAAYPMISATNDVSKRRFDGDEVQVPEASIALGGINSWTDLLPEQYLPILQSRQPNEVPHPTQPDVYRLFRDITASEALAGITLYRGVYITVGPDDAPITDLKVALREGPDNATLTMATEVVSYTYNDPTAYVQRVPNETTAPTGPTFASYSIASPLSLGPVNSQTPVFLWIKLDISAATAAKMYDVFTLSFFNDSDQRFVSFFHTVGSGITSATVSGTLDGSIVQHPYGDTYTISTTNSSGTLVDPPGNTVMVYAASNLTNPVYQNRYPAAGYLPGTVIGQATKSSTGIYKYRFLPSAPGFYYLTFDCGGEIQTNRGVEVTPVV